MNAWIGTGFLDSTSEGSVVGAILGKGIGLPLTATDVMPLG